MSAELCYDATPPSLTLGRFCCASRSGERERERNLSHHTNVTIKCALTTVIQGRRLFYFLFHIILFFPVAHGTMQNKSWNAINGTVGEFEFGATIPNWNNQLTPYICVWRARWRRRWAGFAPRSFSASSTKLTWISIWPCYNMNARNSMQLAH